jgi:hypothetical protein
VHGAFLRQYGLSQTTHPLLVFNNKDWRKPFRSAVLADVSGAPSGNSASVLQRSGSPVHVQGHSAYAQSLAAHTMHPD